MQPSNYATVGKLQTIKENKSISLGVEQNNQVHYSWDCLQQLRDALFAGIEIQVDSVLLPKKLNSGDKCFHMYHSWECIHSQYFNADAIL